MSRFWRAVAHALLLSPGSLQLCPWQHDYPSSGDQDSRRLCNTQGKSPSYVTQLYVLYVWRVMHMHPSPYGNEVTEVGGRRIDCSWAACFSKKAGQQWCNGHFSYCKQNFIFQLIAKYAIQHPGGFRKLLSSKAEQIVCCCFTPSLLARKCNFLVCWHSTHLFKISHPWMHSLLTSSILTGHFTVCTWQLSHVGFWSWAFLLSNMKANIVYFTRCDCVSVIHASDI